MRKRSRTDVDRAPNKSRRQRPTTPTLLLGEAYSMERPSPPKGTPHLSKRKALPTELQPPIKKSKLSKLLLQLTETHIDPVQALEQTIRTIWLFLNNLTFRCTPYTRIQKIKYKLYQVQLQLEALSMTVSMTVDQQACFQIKINHLKALFHMKQLESFS
jgi:hypothetical protein